MNEDTKKRILDFMASNRLTVISTVDVKSNKSEAAVLAFAEKDTLELIFGTSNTSRKYQNLQNNKNVSFVIGWTDELGTLQYEGIARELSGDEAIEHGTLMADKHEGARKFLSHADQRYFLVNPTWLRFTDKSTHPQEVLEVEL
jgi:uncharacterized pyridoxamine 5'-phosphate oxidase family protein